MTRLLTIMSVSLTLISLILPVTAAPKVPTTKQVSSLVDPGKLSTLKSDRAGNPRFRKLMYWIYQAEQQGIKPRDYIARIYAHLPKKPFVSARLVYAPATEKLNLEAQYRLGKLYGLYTPDNLARLRKGNAPAITKGDHRGEKAHVDHLLPRSKYPALENSMANLTWLPASLNLRKSDKVTNAATRRLKALSEEAGMQVE